jgi:hypothetical protein
MYEPVRIRRRLTRRGRWFAFVMTVAAFTGIVVTVLRTMPHPPPAERLSLDELGMLVPDAAQTELIAAMVRSRIAHPTATPDASPSPAAPACVAGDTPHPWDSAQRENAVTIVQVGVVLAIPERGQIVALATAMQESKLYNLGYLGSNNDHDSLGLFQQRPSMGWGSEAQVTDPVYAATAFYLALKTVPGWESMAVTVAAQRVQRSAFPYAYAQWESDATVLVQQVTCGTALL